MVAKIYNVDAVVARSITLSVIQYLTDLILMIKLKTVQYFGKQQYPVRAKLPMTHII